MAPEGVSKPGGNPGAQQEVLFSDLLLFLLPGGSGAGPTTAPVSSEQPVPAANEQSHAADQDNGVQASLLLSVPVPIPPITLPQSALPEATPPAQAEGQRDQAPQVVEVAQAFSLCSPPSGAEEGSAPEVVALELAAPKVDEQPAPQPRQASAKPELAFAARLSGDAAGPEQVRAAEPATESPARPAAAQAAIGPQIRAGQVEAEQYPRDRKAAERPAAPDKPAQVFSNALSSSVAEVQPQAAASRSASVNRPRELSLPPSPMEPAHAEIRSEPLREIALVVPNRAPDGARPESIQVRLLERAGQVHVAVRTADAGLTDALRAQLGELVTRLEHDGYRVETWHPAERTTLAGAIPGVAETSAQQFRAASERGTSTDSGRGNSQNGPDESKQQRRQNEQDSRPRWLDMLEQASTSTRSSRSILYDIAS